MKDYNRLIQRDDVGAWSVITPELIAELRKREGTKVSQNTANQLIDIIANRLADLEDKIENGTLVEFPRVIHPNRMEWFVQYQYPNGVIQYYICFSEAEAEAKLKELKGERLRRKKL